MTMAIFIIAYVGVALILRFIVAKYMPFESTHERNGLDILRGLLAFFVFAGHSVLMSNTLGGQPWWPPRPKDIPVNVLAGVAVDCFFVITGFLFANRRLPSRLSIISFYSRRFRRIYPAYAVLSLFLCAYYAFFGKFNLTLLNLFVFATNRVDIDLPSFNPALYFHIWSLKLEVFFYLVLPLIYLLSIRLYQYAYILVLGLLTVFIDNRFIFIMAGYFFGVNKDLVHKSVKIIQIRIVLILATICLLTFLTHYYFDINRWLLFFLRISLALFMVAIFLELKVSQKFNVFCTIGDMSYSLYLCHGLASVISYEFALKFNPNIIDSDLFILFSVPMLVLLTVAVFRLSEYYYFRRS